MENVKRMEQIFDKQEEILKRLNEVLEELENTQSDYKLLKEYYLSEVFLEDVENEEFKGIKCGILSEDAVFNLIGDMYETGIRLLETGTAIVKEH